jgi:hypothetical protein
MAVAFIALCIALGGTAAALEGQNGVFKDDLRANSVGRSEILRGGVGKPEIRADSVGQSEVIEGSMTGRQIREVSLGTVPQARTAQTSGFAEEVEDLRRFSFQEDAPSTGATSRTVLSIAGLNVVASCSSAGDLEVIASRTQAGQLQSASTDTVDEFATAFNEYQTALAAPLDLVDFEDNNQLGHTEWATNAGAVLSINWQADNPGLARDCVFTGTAVGTG